MKTAIAILESQTENETIRTGQGTGKKLRLQPAMTQWMMGYPDLWTEFPTVEPSGEKKASKPTGTESSQK